MSVKKAEEGFMSVSPRKHHRRTAPPAGCSQYWRCSGGVAPPRSRQTPGRTGCWLSSAVVWQNKGSGDPPSYQHYCNQTAGNPSDYLLEQVPDSHHAADTQTHQVLGVKLIVDYFCWETEDGSELSHRLIKDGMTSSCLNDPILNHENLQFYKTNWI